MLVAAIGEDGEVHWRTDTAYFVVAVFCDNCGYMHLFNGAVIDTLSPPSGDAPIDEQQAGVM
jgi:hypothetical protein